MTIPIKEGYRESIHPELEVSDIEEGCRYLSLFIGRVLSLSIILRKDPNTSQVLYD